VIAETFAESWRARSAPSRWLSSSRDEDNTSSANVSKFFAVASYASVKAAFSPPLKEYRIFKSPEVPAGDCLDAGRNLDQFLQRFANVVAEVDQCFLDEVVDGLDPLFGRFARLSRCPADLACSVR
jgi:hypothetical protein